MFVPQEVLVAPVCVFPRTAICHTSSVVIDSLTDKGLKNSVRILHPFQICL